MIGIEKTTYDRLVSMQDVNLTLGITEFGSIDNYLNDIINVLIEEHNEIYKYIERYIEGAKGKCICKSILGQAVVSNHHFDLNNICMKCGIQAPIKIEREGYKTVIHVGNEVK